MKKALAAFLTAAMTVTTLTGCLGSSVSAPTTAAPAESTAAETSAAAEGAATEAASSVNLDNIGEHTFSLSTTATAGSALADVAHHFADKVSELSGGKMTVDVFEGSSLGSEAQNLEALTAGTLDCLLYTSGCA